MSTGEQKTPEKLTTKNNESTTVRMPQFTPPSNRKESQISTASSSTMTRQERDAERKRRQRASETSEERERRNEKKRLDARRKRSSESSDTSRDRLSKQQAIDKVRRSNQTAEQHRARLDQQQVIDTTRRSTATPEQHRARLDQQQAINTTLRSNETPEQHRARLDQQQAINTTLRSNETTEERTTRIRSDSRRRQQRATERRNNLHQIPWPTPISKKIKESCLTEFNKRMTMNSLREQVCVVCNARYNERTMHNMLLSNINENLLKPHANLLGTIPGAELARPQDTDFDEETKAFSEQPCRKSIPTNTTYLISSGRILYRDGLIQNNSQSEADCRMCHECWLAISKGKISKFSPANGMWIGDVPDQLKGLTIPEQKLISLYRHNSCIIKLHSPWHSPSTAQPALKGNCITFPQNLSNIASSLPLSPAELSSSIKIIFVGSSIPSRHHLRKILTVRRQRVLDALVWLKENNVLYGHISLDKHIISALPDDDIPESIWETLDHISDDKNALAEREGYTEDPLTSNEAMSEQATSDFIPLNPSGVLDVNGASVSAEDISSHMLHKLRIDSNSHSVDPSESNTDDDVVHIIPRGTTPGNEYNNPTLLLGLYPTLFPYGTGAFEDASRPVKISLKKQIQYLLSYHDRRFEEHHSFIFIVFNMLQRREACLHARLMTSKPYFSKTADQIVSLKVDDIKQVLNNFEKSKINASGRSPQVNALLSQVKAVGGKVMGSAYSRSALRNQIHGLIFNQGLPSIFLTINPADINSRVALYFAGVDLDLDAIIPNNLPSTYQRAEIIASHPVATAKFFHHLITTVLETMIAGEKVLGPVKAYFGTVENQGRGSLHLHMLIWLDHSYTPAQLRENIRDEQFRNNLRDYLEDIISEDLDHL